MTVRRTITVGGLALMTLVTACSADQRSRTTPSSPAVASTAPVSPGSTTPPTSASDGSARSTPSTPGDGEAAAYCVSKGGTVETRHPYLGTNLDPSQWVRLAGSIELCRFESDDADHSRIYVDTLSLAAPTQSLAAAAYLAKLPMAQTSGGANPAAVNCTDTVHGSSSWGPTANGGGWVNLDDTVFTVVDLCVFSDRSAVDEWGIAYYSGGITRGADLAPLFRSSPTPT